IGLKENSTGASGIVWVKSTTTNQQNIEVLSWVRWVMVKKNNLTATAPKVVIPNLPSSVSKAQLTIPSYFKAHDEISMVTGGQYFWGDYEVGERIDHVAGATINPAEHTLATRLYQNNAHLHFDDHLMKKSHYGQRLVYGGVVISLCRALSYEGLENALTILAINAGTHANPSFAGDTIYCATEVIDRHALNDRTDMGALRLRMVGIKNMLPSQLSEFKSGEKYHPNVVLDLDYTVAMPLRGN
ncbi:MAG: hypothetical protein ABGW96_00080, partial [Methylophilaceae bacterium]